MNCFRIAVIVGAVSLARPGEPFAQTDKIAGADTSLDDIVDEKIVEQTAEPEDSPLLDYFEGQNQRGRRYLKLRSRFFLRLQKSVGYLEGSYLGSPLKSYQRIKFWDGSRFSGGMLMEKDAGEKSLSDFISGNLTISRTGPVPVLIIGDYFVEAGQGLVLWRGYDVSKGAEIFSSARKSGSGLSAYLSSGESRFLRGIAAEMKIGSVSAAFFYSRSFLSAAVDSLGRVTSLYDAGYFRTKGEISKKHSLVERLVGSRLAVPLSRSGLIGATVYAAGYSRNMTIQSGCRFSGEKLSAGSLDYNFSYKNLALFGEAVKSGKSFAAISGIMIAPVKEAGIIASARYYPPGYFNPHGLPFGGQASNEYGFYTGVRIRPSDIVAFASYYDQYREIVQTTDRFPSTGTDFLSQFEITLARELILTVKYRRQIGDVFRTIDAPHDLKKDVSYFRKKQNVRLNLDSKLMQGILLRTRVEKVFLRGNSSGECESGFLFYQEVGIRTIKKTFIDLRVNIFRTDSYFTGIGGYERDLDGVLTLPVLYGSGVRWYILIKIEPVRRAKFSLKYSETTRDDIKKIGTGLDQIRGNRDNRLGVQLDIEL